VDNKPTPPLLLKPDHVHLWWIRLDVPEARLRELAASLNADERERAARFRRPEDRDRFIAARGSLRTTLSRYLGMAPAAIRFTYGPHGKPALETHSGQAPLTFNLSHSRGLALLGVTLDRRIGVDVEWIRPEFATEETAVRYFAAGEVAALRSVPPAERAAAFFRCWTRKEAYLKAIGKGLLLPLDSFEVSLRPDDAAALLSARDDPAAPQRWDLRDLDAGAGCAAALAVEGRGLELHCWECNAETR
jgi:4'-phosphopantetheinyl transferase